MIMKKMLWRLSLLFLAVLASGLADAPAYGQAASDWWRRQQQQQQQQQRQQEAERQRRQQEVERQRLREQERQRLREQERLRLQQMERDRLIQRQRRQAANENVQRRPAVNDNVQRQAAGVVRLNRPLTAGELRGGFTGKVTQDGRALVKTGGRVLAVPPARAAVRASAAQSTGAAQASRWSASKRASISADVRRLAVANPNNKTRTGGGRRPPGGGGGDDGNPPTNNQVKVQFGKLNNQTSHAFRHTDKAGLDRKAVKEAIQADLAKVGGSLPKRHYNGTVSVNGRQLVYSAFKLPDGTINVGSIKPQSR